MTRRKKPGGPKPVPARAAPPPRSGVTAAAPALDEDGEEAPPPEAELRAVVLDRLAQAVHPELFLALQEHLPEPDPRWITLFAHAFDNTDTVSPLLRLSPVALNPVRFSWNGTTLPAAQVVAHLGEVFSSFPLRRREWEARLSFHTIQALGEALCAALGREGMGEVIGAVEASLTRPHHQVPVDAGDAPLPLDTAAVGRLALEHAPNARARVWLGARLEVAFPGEDDEELDHLVTESLRALEVRMGPAPAFAVEVCAPGRPWLPIQDVLDALQRRLRGGLRVLRT